MAHHKLKRLIANLPPAYFAMVMATGIVSIAAHLHGLEIVAHVMLWLNAIFYVFLWILTLARMALYPRNILFDLEDHIRAPGYFTMVAGTCVLGSQILTLSGSARLPWLLLALGAGLWVVFMYSVFTGLIIRRGTHRVERTITGVWLVAVVSTQSVSVLNSWLISHLSAPNELMVFLSLCMFLIGLTIYLIIITLIFYRLVFFGLRPAAVSPSYWVNMGAVAISTLAGSMLSSRAPYSTLLQTIQPFVLGMTVLAWATATWWIPLLLTLFVWRHAIRRLGFTYTPEYWSLVFPLGMYTVCTVEFAKATGLDWLTNISSYSVYVALVAWLFTATGMFYSLFRYFACGLPTSRGVASDSIGAESPDVRLRSKEWKGRDPRHDI